MDQVVPWAELMAVIEPFWPKGERGRPPFPLETMLRIHLMQQWYALSDPAMEEALNEIVPRQEFAGLSLLGAVPDETTILAFRHRLEQHGLAQRLFEVVAAHLVGRNLFVKQGTIVDARIDHASGSTKNAGRCRDPEMHQTRKGNQWHFGMKLHVGCDPDTGPLQHPPECQRWWTHTRGCSANIACVQSGPSSTAELPSGHLFE